MNESERMVLRPTPWFLLRAVAMLAMFGIFAGWFFYDWKIGYPRKNLVYCLHRAFEKAGREVVEKSAGGTMTAEAWASEVAAGVVEVPANPSLLPPGTPRPLPWPEALQDFGRLREGKWYDVWLDYTAAKELPAKPPEHLYDEGKIREQWLAGAVCAVLAAGALVVLLRTLGRTLEVDAEGLKAPGGHRVPWRDLKRLDRRKWANKGLAYAYYEAGGGERRIRIDGLTYGGFKEEQGVPAERLMERVMANFSGELIDYEEVGAEEK